MFLTLEDPRAKIQGSRDPLGIQPVWATFGRHLVSNLTTVTNSVREFTTLLLARYVGEVLAERGAIHEEDAVDAFLRVEQMSAYARYISEGPGFIRGITRVRRFVDESSGRVPISTDPRHLILSDQRTYGLWGLFSVSGRASGLLEDGPIGVTPLAREFFENEYLPYLDQSMDRILTLARSGGHLKTRKNDAVLAGLARVFAPELSKAEKEFYGRTLRDAAEATVTTTPGRQAHLARLIIEHMEEEERLDRTVTRKLTKAAQHAGDDSLADWLRRCDRVEALIAPAEAAFELLITRDGQKPAAVAKELREIWGGSVPHVGEGFTEIRSEIESVTSRQMADVMYACDDALSTGNYESCIDSLFFWNDLVMGARGGAPWVSLGDDGRIKVRFTEQEQLLPGADELVTYWRNSYFLDSLHSIAWQIETGIV